MSESKGKLKNRILMEVYDALERVGQNDKLPVVTIGSRLALNRNSLRPLVAAIDESRSKLMKDGQIRNTSAGTISVIGEGTAGLTLAEKMAKVDAFQEQVKELMEQETTWSPVATIELKKFNDDSGVPSNALAALMEAGIVIGDAPPEVGPDRKKSKAEREAEREEMK